MSSTPTPPPGPAPSDTGLAPHIAAGLCAVFPLIGGIVFYFIEKKDQFVRHWAVQGIFLGAAWFVGSIALNIINFVIMHVPFLGALVSVLLGLAFSLGMFILWVLGIIKAFQGQTWEYPFISEQAKKLFPKFGA